MFLTALFTILSITQLYNIPFTTGIELDYEELKSINGSCSRRDTCQDYLQPNTEASSCTCNRFCSKYGTCCIDSLHRKNLLPNPRPECRILKGDFKYFGNYMANHVHEAYYMVDKCSSSGEFDSMWKIPCEADWKEEDSGLFPLAPVTSLLSAITYKNYFCLRCHEKTNDFLYWNSELTVHYNGSANLKEDFAKEDYILKYSQRNKTWMAIVGTDNVLVPVKMIFEIPSRIESMIVTCYPNTIFECSDLWTDGSVREKCNAYQALISIKKGGKSQIYRNPHCALCNFQTLENKECFFESFIKTTFNPASFTHTVDVNRFDGDKLIPTKQKCGENLVWDPFVTKCKKLSCSDPRLEIRDRKCVPQLNFPENPEKHSFS